MTLKVYDVLGREVATLVDGQMAPGRQQVVWNGKSTSGREVPTGIYIARLTIRPAGQARLTAPAATRSVKLVLLR